MTDTAERPASPCVSVCRLDTAGVCLGCFRLLDEISGWSAANPGEQRRILARAELRRQRADTAV
ncbi:MAG: DUF1289 domain-containing protein [Chromatiales bacterium]|jgi:predicted Fe-S protein YdhL (DUF1289 family)